MAGWIKHHAQGDNAEALQAPQVCLDLGDDRRGIDSTPLVAALALPADTLVAPLRVAWLPSDRKPSTPDRDCATWCSVTRAIPVPGAVAEFSRNAPERMHLLVGERRTTVANLRARFEPHAPDR